MLRLRTMTIDDIPLGMRLKALAGWNQTEADWRRFFQLCGEGAWVAQWDGQPVGNGVTFLFGSIGWIAMLLVDPAFRRRGIGTALMQQALGHLDRLGVKTARLDATPLGRPVYEKLGFVAEYDLARLEGTAAGGSACEEVRPMMPAELGAILELDRQVTGTDRARLIEGLVADQSDAARVFAAGDRITGYLLVREGSRATQIGPAVALTTESGLALANDALHRLSGQTVFIDVPTNNAPATQWAESHGLVLQRYLTRMRRGEPVRDQPARLWASSGPEKG